MGILKHLYITDVPKSSCPCTQKFSTHKDIESQLRKAILDVAIPAAWISRWLKLLDEYEISEKQNREVNIQRLEEDEKAIENKLNILLDSFLDGVTDGKTYKLKKNELFEKKLKLQEEISKVRLNGSSWLERMREFIETSKTGAKIARAKNHRLELLFN